MLPLCVWAWVCQIVFAITFYVHTYPCASFPSVAVTITSYLHSSLLAPTCVSTPSSPSQSLMKVKHPNLVKLKEVIREDNKLYFVFEYMRDNLLELIQKRGWVNHTCM